MLHIVKPKSNSQVLDPVKSSLSPKSLQSWNWIRAFNILQAKDLLWPSITSYDLRSDQSRPQSKLRVLSIDQGTAGHLAQNIILESKIEELKLHTPSGPSRSQDLLTQEDRIHEKKENKENNGHLMAANELECHALIWGCNLSWLPTLTLSRDLRDLRVEWWGLLSIPWGDLTCYVII